MHKVTVGDRKDSYLVHKPQEDAYLQTNVIMQLRSISHLIRFMIEWSVQKEVVCHNNPQANTHKSDANELILTHGNPPITSSAKQISNKWHESKSNILTVNIPKMSQYSKPRIQLRKQFIIQCYSMHSWKLLFPCDRKQKFHFQSDSITRNEHQFTSGLQYMFSGQNSAHSRHETLMEFIIYDTTPFLLNLPLFGSNAQSPNISFWMLLNTWDNSSQ